MAIERLIASHPAVREVAVLGLPDRALGGRFSFYTLFSKATGKALYRQFEVTVG